MITFTKASKTGQTNPCGQRSAEWSTTGAGEGHDPEGTGGVGTEAGNFLFLDLGADHIIVFTLKISGVIHLLYVYFSVFMLQIKFSGGKKKKLLQNSAANLLSKSIKAIIWFFCLLCSEK